MTQQCIQGRHRFNRFPWFVIMTLLLNFFLDIQSAFTAWHRRRSCWGGKGFSYSNSWIGIGTAGRVLTNFLDFFIDIFIFNCKKNVDKKYLDMLKIHWLSTLASNLTFLGDKIYERSDALFLKYIIDTYFMIYLFFVVQKFWRQEKSFFVCVFVYCLVVQILRSFYSINIPVILFNKLRGWIYEFTQKNHYSYRPDSRLFW